MHGDSFLDVFPSSCLSSFSIPISLLRSTLLTYIYIHTLALAATPAHIPFLPYPLRSETTQSLERDPISVSARVNAHEPARHIVAWCPVIGKCAKVVALFLQCYAQQHEFAHDCCVSAWFIDVWCYSAQAGRVSTQTGGSSQNEQIQRKPANTRERPRTQPHEHPRMSANTRECPRTSANARECPRMSANVREHPRTHREHPRTPANTREHIFGQFRSRCAPCSFGPSDNWFWA